MSSVNKVILMGRLGRDPDVRYMPNGDPVASFGLATTENWRDRNSEKQSRIEWHQIEIYGRLADVAGQYLKKGSLVYLEGKIKTNESEENGVKRKDYKIVCNTMTMIGADNGGAQSNNEPTPAPLGRSNDAGPAVNDLDDKDIPF